MEFVPEYIATIKKIRAYLEAATSGKGKLQTASSEQKNAWMHEVLAAHRYELLDREDKGIIRKYLQHETGYSRSQLERTISAYREQSKQASLEAGHAQAAPLSHLGLKQWFCISALLLLCAMGMVKATPASVSSDTLVFLNNEDEQEYTLNDENADVFAMRQSIEQGEPIVTKSYVTMRTTENGELEVMPLFVAQEEIVPTGERKVVRRRTHATSGDELVRRRDERREQRLAALPIETSVFEQTRQLSNNRQSSTSYGQTIDRNVFASAFGTVGLLGDGQPGQVLMFVEGRAQWQDLSEYVLTKPGLGRKPQIRGGHGSAPSPYGGGGGRRYGGGGGGSTTASTTTQTVINNTTIINSGSGSSNDGVFIGTTTLTTYDGSFTSGAKVGYDAANAICAADYAGSHFCRTDEIIATIASQDISTLFSGVADAWIAEGPPGFTANSNDCDGWTSNTLTNLGAWWDFETSGGGAGYLTNCSTTKPLACCR